MKYDSLKDAISYYLDKGFGSWTKNDFEVFIFNELLKSDFQGLLDNDISVKLKIPVSKVTRLRYEARLKFGEFEIGKELPSILGNVHFRLSGSNCKLCFQIEDKWIRAQIANQLKRGYRLYDSSFNSEIISLDIDDLEWLLKEYCPERLQKLSDELQAELKKQGKLPEKDTQKGSFFKQMILSAVHGLGVGATSSIFHLILG